jgi:CubicO group peptidase (beta-lactamase class C family)
MMTEKYVPGAVFVMVKDGAVFIRKGYGYANVDEKTPVLPDQTLFRIASVSKLINATAVMQLVEQGKLELNEDVNAALERYRGAFRLPATFPEPVTLLDCLNHTGGFDERAIGMSSASPGDRPALGEYLARRMPARAMPPRETISYSNHAAALAGYLVELASGRPYNDYVTEHIFAPLGMTHSSFELTDELRPHMATGYRYGHGDHPEAKYDYLNIPPAGAMLSTGDDMARFMLAHLQGGEYNSARILQDSTVREMHAIQYKQDPRLGGGMGVAFFANRINGEYCISHGGDLGGFASLLFLIPERGIGLFTSCNVDESSLRGMLIRKFMDRFFPEAESTTPEPPQDFSGRAGKYTGTYRFNRYARNSIEKLTTLMSQTPVVHDGKGGLLILTGKPEPARLIEIEPDVFVNVKEGNRIVFRTDAAGNVTHLLLDQAAFERVGKFEKSSRQFLFLGASVAVLLSGTLGWPFAALRGRRRGLPYPAQIAPLHYRLVGWVVCALSSVCMIALGWTLFKMDDSEFRYGMPRRLAALLTLPPAIVVGSVVFAVLAAAAWRNGYWSRTARVHYTLVAIVCLALVPFMWHWNIIGFKW